MLEGEGAALIAASGLIMTGRKDGTKTVVCEEERAQHKSISLPPPKITDLRKKWCWSDGFLSGCRLAMEKLSLFTLPFAPPFSAAAAFCAAWPAKRFRTAIVFTLLHVPAHEIRGEVNAHR